MKNLVSREQYRDLNRRLIPYNIIIAIIALVVSVTLVFGNFFSVTVNVNVGDAIPAIRDFLNNGDSSEDYYGGFDLHEHGNPLARTGENYYYYNNGGDNGFFGDLGEDFIDMIIDSLVGFEINLTLRISNWRLLTGITGNMLEGVLYDVLTDLQYTVTPLVTEAVGLVASAAVDFILETAVNEIIEAGDGGGAASDIAEALPLDEVSNLISEIIGGDLNQYDALARFIAIAQIVADELYAQGVLEHEWNIEEVVDGFEEVFESVIEMVYELLADETGYINTETLIFDLLGNFLELEGEDFTAEDITAGMAALIVDFIQGDYYDGGAYGIINWVLIGFAGLLIATIAAWVLLFLFAILRLFTKNKRVYLGNARGIGWVVFSIFVLLPTIFLNFILPIIPALGMAAGLAGFGLTVSFMSMTITSFIGACLLMIIKWAGYGRFKRRVRHSKIAR